MISGATTNSIKPICILHKTMAFRSHIGLISRPSERSRSPCGNNETQFKIR
jgi:hypothetical protein